MRFTLLALTLCSTALPALADEVNIYSHRQPELIQPLLDAFTAESGSGPMWPLSTRAWPNGWWRKATDPLPIW